MNPALLIRNRIQLAVFLDNRPGALAQVCATLAKNSINIDALATESGGFFGSRTDEVLVRMVVSDSAKALTVLAQGGTDVLQTNVLLIEAENRPDMLAQIAECLARTEVNIESIYLSGSSDASNRLIILQPSDLDKAQRVLRDL